MLVACKSDASCALESHEASCILSSTLLSVKMK